jgi:hypothetical protein
MAKEFSGFRRAIPRICRQRGLVAHELTFGDFANMTAEYLPTITSP